MSQSNFLPFGSQYYRYPTPLRSEWKKDLASMKANGFNIIKIWAQWRSNQPGPDTYWFEDLDELMSLAQENGLKVIINVIMDVAPAWFYQKYPDSIMIHADGTKLNPSSTEYRQVGGAPGPCYHHPEAIRTKYAFVAELSRRYSGHPALYAWDLWNEPELSCGISRAPSESKMPCYCDHSAAAFRAWLKEKYHTIEQLNGAWGRNYNSFEEAELPRNPRTFNDMMDWRRFFADTLTQDLASRVEAIRLHDSVTPVMVHTVPPPHFNMINACADDYQMAKLCDMFGNSTGSSAFPATLSVCSAKGKPVINAEIHAMGGETFNHPHSVSYNDFKSHIFTPLSKGIKGFLFWQYRPELIGRESPAWGLTDLEGHSTQHLEHVARINRYLQENNQFFCECQPLPAKIAVIKDNDNERFAWCANATTDKYLFSLMGAYQAFQDANFNVDILTADQMVEEDISSYQLLYYPLPYYMSEKIATRLAEWVQNGGTLVTECFFGAYRAENNLHSTKIPGYGFDALCRIKEGESFSISSFQNAYSQEWSQQLQGFDGVDIRYRSTNGEEWIIPGYYFYEELLSDQNEPLGSFSDGKTAIMRCPVGKGAVIFLGSLPGAGYHLTQSKVSLHFFKDLAARAGLTPEVQINQEGIRADVLVTDRQKALILRNLTDYEGSIEVSVTELSSACPRLVKMDTNEIIEPQSCDDGLRFTCQISSFEVAVYLSPL